MSENVTLRTNLAVGERADALITTLVGRTETKIPIRVTRIGARQLCIGDSDVRAIIAMTIEDDEVTHLVSGKVRHHLTTARGASEVGVMARRPLCAGAGVNSVR